MGRCVDASSRPTCHTLDSLEISLSFRKKWYFWSTITCSPSLSDVVTSSNMTSHFRWRDRATFPIPKRSLSYGLVFNLNLWKSKWMVNPPFLPAASSKMEEGTFRMELLLELERAFSVLCSWAIDILPWHLQVTYNLEEYDYILRYKKR